MKVYGFLSIVGALVTGLSFVSSRSTETSLLENYVFVRSVRATSEDDSVKEEDGSTYPKRATVFFFVYGILVLLAFIGWRRRRSKLKARNNNSIDYNLLQNIYNGMRDTGEAVPEELKDRPVHEQLRTHYVPYKKKYEISNENLEKKEYLGRGNFGVVRMGLLKMADPKTEEEEKKRLTVALKSAANCYDITQTSMLADELRLMCAIGRFPNVLALVGAVTVELRRERLLIVTEFIDCGDLHSYLKVHKDIFEDHLVKDEKDEPDSFLIPLSAKRKTYMFTKEGGEQDEVVKESLKSLTTSDLLSFGLQIANGMQYLASIPGSSNRDLALRNVLLKKNKTVRIADFGMARIHQTSLYYRTKKTKDAPIPVRWMSPEAVDNMIFTQQSDVWSYGICLYELFTLGGLPYPEIKRDDVYDYMISGRRCSQPEHCHVELYNLMKLCWNMKPELRPTFSVIVEYVIEHMKNSAPQLLDYVEKMLKVEADNQRQLDDWIRTRRKTSKTSLSDISRQDEIVESKSQTIRDRLENNERTCASICFEKATIVFSILFVNGILALLVSALIWKIFEIEEETLQ